MSEQPKLAESDSLRRLRVYSQGRAARFSACPGGGVTRYVGKYLWHCDGCGEDFTDEAQAHVPKHTTEDQ